MASGETARPVPHPGGASAGGVFSEPHPGHTERDRGTHTHETWFEIDRQCQFTGRSSESESLVGLQERLKVRMDYPSAECPFLRIRPPEHTVVVEHDCADRHLPELHALTRYVKSNRKGISR